MSTSALRVCRELCSHTLHRLHVLHERCMGLKLVAGRWGLWLSFCAASPHAMLALHAERDKGKGSVLDQQRYVITAMPLMVLYS